MAERPGFLSAYLVARVHALRWIEERLRPKNNEIAKPLMNIAQLQDFTLGAARVFSGSMVARPFHIGVLLDTYYFQVLCITTELLSGNNIYCQHQIDERIYCILR